MSDDSRTTLHVHLDLAVYLADSSAEGALLSWNFLLLLNLEEDVCESCNFFVPEPFNFLNFLNLISLSPISRRQCFISKEITT